MCRWVEGLRYEAGRGDEGCAASINKWRLEQMWELYDVQVGAEAGPWGRGRGEDGDKDVQGSHRDVWLMTNTSRLTYTLAPKPTFTGVAEDHSMSSDLHTVLRNPVHRCG